MERFKHHPISTTLGLIFILFSGVLLFIPTLYEIPLWVLGLVVVFGVLLIYSKDKLIDILTLGLSRLIQDRIDKSK